MAWEGVPWMVAGGNHSAEVGRLLAYAATGSGEGVIGPTDCKVVASAIPDGNIHIQPGAVAMLNRFPGGSSQAYLARNVGDEVKALTPQGSSGVRYDLVALIVEDPQYPGQPAPASVPNGPYVKTVVYEDVPAATISLAEVDPGQTGYALALVKFDASDGTVNQADITDLRDLLIVRQQTIERMQQHNATTNTPAAAALHPPTATYEITIPKWAAKVQLKAIWSGIQGVDTGTGAGSAIIYGSVRLGVLASNLTQAALDAQAATKTQTTTILAADEIAIPENMRGTKQNLQAYMHAAVANMTIRSTAYTTVLLAATFLEAPI